MIKDFWEEYARDKSVLSAVWEMGPEGDDRLVMNTLTGDWFRVSQVQEAMDKLVYDYLPIEPPRTGV